MSALKIKILKEGFSPEKIFKDILSNDEKNIFFIPIEVNDVKIWTKMSIRKDILSLSLEPASRIPSKAANQVFSKIIQAIKETCDIELLTHYAKDKWIKSENEIPRSETNNIDFENLSIEIGFGKGTWLLKKAEKERWLGIEYSRYSIDQINKRKSPNLNVTHAPASIVIQAIPEKKIKRYVCICPDPWPKKRHQKRIWLNENTLKDIARTLKDDGYFSLATDHEQLAEYFSELLEDNEWFDISESKEIDEMISYSKYAKIGKDELRDMHKWHLVKKKHPESSSAKAFSKDPVQLSTSFAGLNQLKKQSPEIQSEHGVLKVKEIASGKDGEVLLSLIYVDSLGNNQPFLYIFDGKKWQFDEFTKPAIDYGLMKSLEKLGN